MWSSLKDALDPYIDAQGGNDGVYSTGIEALTLMRSSRETLPQHLLYRPALCVVAQGAKRVMLGDDAIDYCEMQYLVVSVEMPLLGSVTRANVDEPYLGLMLEFDMEVMREVMEQLDEPPRVSGNPAMGVFVDTCDGPLADGIARLVRILGNPQAIRVLYPSVMREICYWLLTGSHGSEICKLALPSGHTQRIAQAIRVLRSDFARPIRIEQLAAAAQMSPSSFHQNFKSLTAMTPLQYQKQLRLLEARRLMLIDAVSVTDAAYHVGYESVSQFSREYSRMFGAPPRRDVIELRAISA
jgi:AraC-like DNA-binding protein